MPATASAPIRRFTSSGDFVRAEVDDQGRAALLVGVDDLDGVDLATLEPEEATELGLWLLRHASRTVTFPDDVVLTRLLDRLSRELGAHLR